MLNMTTICPGLVDASWVILNASKENERRRRRLYLVIVKGEEYRLKNESKYIREKKVKSSFGIL